MTPQEVKLWSWLREEIVPVGFHLRRQVPIDGVIVDFACLAAALAIEIDGEQHGMPAGRVRDAARDAHLAGRGYRVLRFTNREVDREKRAVLDTIYAALVERAQPRPVPNARHVPTPVGFADSPSPAG